MARAWFLIASVLAFAFAGFLALEQRNLGFPDGYLTELDRAKKLYYPVFTLLGTLLGAYFAYLALRYPEVSLKKYLIQGAVLFVVFILSFAGLSLILSFNLDGGRGA